MKGRIAAKKLIKAEKGINYKKSFYNVEISNEDEKVILFNTFSESLIELSLSEFELINKKEKFNVSENNNFTYDLIRNGFLVPEDFNELKEVKSFINNSWCEGENVVIVIAPTTYCNMQCPYCFEQGIVQPKMMKESVQNQIVKYVEENYSNKNLSVVWYGGEPLVDFNVVRNISRKLINIASKNNRNYTSAMVTNASLLDKDIADVLKEECKVQVLQITLDGTEEVNNERRKLRNGKKSFKTIVNNIDYAKDLFKISLRINVDSNNIKEVRDLLDWISRDKKDWSGRVVPYVAPVTMVNEKIMYKNTMKREKFSDIFKDNYLDYFMNNSETNKIILNPKEEYFLDQCCALERKAWRGLFPFSLTKPCGVPGNNLIVIDPEGNLYKCWDTVGDKKHIVGDIYTGLYNNEMCEKWINYNISEKCDECTYLPICLGGCVRECALNNGIPSCPQDLNYYKDVLKMYVKKYEEKYYKEVELCTM